MGINWPLVSVFVYYCKKIRKLINKSYIARNYSMLRAEVILDKVMLEVSKCEGLDCPLKERCRRYTSEADDYQAYLIPLDYLDGECEQFINDEFVI